MSKRPATTLSDELIDFVAQGVSLLVGTCDAARVPHAARAVGLRIHDDRRHATVYLPEVTARHTVTDVAVNPRLAVMVSQPLDHKAFQMKGDVRKVSAAAETERELIETYLSLFGRRLEVVGMPYEVVTMLSHWPAVALEFSIEGLYLQTPGPGAGQRLSGSSL
ncbi:MAG TPA: pyridoxamine 5'-phosphate oxidase family protein [Polyangiales bacterium]